MTELSARPSPSAVTVLAFDTSTASLAAAVVRDGVVAGSLRSDAERNHSVLIVPELKRLLAECGLTTEDVDVVAAGRGPGSYTGVRIAVTVAKTLAWTWNKPLLGVSSLEALALGAWQSHNRLLQAGTAWVVPVMDARRGQVYTSRYAADSTGRWEVVDADGIRMAGDWARFLRGQAAEEGAVSEIWFVGETAIHEESAWASSEAVAEDGRTLTRVLPYSMEAGAVGWLALSRYLRGEKDDVHTFVPNYTQLAEAEAKLLASSRRE